MYKLSLLFVVLLLFSCKKKEDRTCFKSWGDDIERTVDPGSFEKLFVSEHVIIELVQDTTCFLVLKGGENMLNLVEINVDDDKLLSIENKNHCSFLRGFKRKVEVEIHFDNLYNIHFEGSEPMTCRNTINSDYFTFLIRDGAGHVSLKLNSKEVWGTITHGWGDFTLTGKTGYANLDVRSNGYCDTRDLQINDSLRFISNTSANMFLDFDQVDVRGKIICNGNVYYTGIPSLLDVTNTGNGKLISLN